MRWWLVGILAPFGKFDWAHCFGSLVDLISGSVFAWLVLLWWSNMNTRFDVS